MADEFQYTWTDNPTVSGVAQCDTDVLNECLMHLKYDKKDGADGAGLEVCDIGMSLYVDESLGLRRYLNGQIVDLNKNTQVFFDKLQKIQTLHPSLFDTEDNWQSAKTLSAYGQVGKFVFNYEGVAGETQTIQTNVNRIYSAPDSSGQTHYYMTESSIPWSNAFAEQIQIYEICAPSEGKIALGVHTAENWSQVNDSFGETTTKVDIDGVQYTITPYAESFNEVWYYTYTPITQEIKSVRLPRVVNVQGLFDLANLGMTVQAGLPNITGTATLEERAQDSTPTGTGAFSVATHVIGYSGYSKGDGYGTAITFNASKSNSIYGNSNTVQPEAIQYPYFIQIATGAETENNIINEIELNNPFSFGDSKYSPVELNNISWLKSEGQWNSKAVYTDYYDWILENVNNEVDRFKKSTDTYDDYDFVINTADETFRLPLLDGSEDLIDYNTSIDVSPVSTPYLFTQNGFLFIQAKATGSNNTTVAINDKIVFLGWSGEQYATADNAIIPVKRASKLTQKEGVFSYLSFIPATGNGSLYYYVGETVQNANLIDAGRIGEVLASRVHLVDSYVNGTSGYRLYSDGYCEQWGNILIPANSTTTVSLFKSYSSAKYVIVTNKRCSETGSTDNWGAYAPTTDSFSFANGHGSEMYYDWCTRGYVT